MKKAPRSLNFKLVELEIETDFKIDFLSIKQRSIKMNTEIKETIISTPFMGVGFSENGPSDPRINKALEKTCALLDIMEFIKVTKFKLNEVMFDYFWQIMVGNTRAHLGSRILEWFGYEGEYRTQKQKFLDMLKRNDITFDELTTNDKEIDLYPTIKEELALLPSNVKNSKFLVMEPRNLKKAIMKLNTKNGNAIREYYVDVEDLMKLYVEYTIYHNYRESQRKITSLEVMMADMRLKEAKADKQREEDVARMERQEQYMRSLGISLEEVKDQNETLIDQNDSLIDKTKHLEKQNKGIQRKLGIAVEDRAPLPDDTKKQERFILIKRHDPDYMAYYTIRAQYGYTQTKMKAERANFPNHEILLDFRCNPNSKTLYVRIKENLKAKGVVFKGNNIDLDESEVNEEELIREMTSINERKYNV
jgi:hypothetical protein